MHWMIWRKTLKVRFDDAKQLAAELGAADGRSSLETDFADWAEQILHQIFTDEYGELGTAPELLKSQRTELESQLAVSLDEDMAVYARPTPKPLWLGSSAVLLTGIAVGLGVDIAGWKMNAIRWAAVVCTSALAIVVLHAASLIAHELHRLYSTAACAWYRWRLRRRCNSLARKQWRAETMRNAYDQFVTPRKIHLLEIYSFYQRAGAFKNERMKVVA